MAVFNNMFKSGGGKPDNKKNVLSWQELKSFDQIETIIEKSNSNPQIIFKHSTRCGISASVLRRFEKQLSEDTSKNEDFYLLNVIQNRDVSNEIASKFNVIHHSPQLLIIKNGAVVANDSHYEVLTINIDNY